MPADAHAPELRIILDSPNLDAADHSIKGWVGKSSELEGEAEPYGFVYARPSAVMRSVCQPSSGSAVLGCSSWCSRM